MKKYIIYATGNMFFDGFEEKEVVNSHTIWKDDFPIEKVDTIKLRDYFPDFLSGVKDFKIVELSTLVISTSTLDNDDSDNFINITVSKVIKNWKLEPPDFNNFEEDYLD